MGAMQEDAQGVHVVATHRAIHEHSGHAPDSKRHHGHVKEATAGM